MSACTVHELSLRRAETFQYLEIIGMSKDHSTSMAPLFRDVLLNPLPNKPCFLRVCSISLLKTLWEKKKLLVTNNFSFSHCIFYLFHKLSAIFIKFEIVVGKLFQFGRVKNLLFGKGLKKKNALSPFCHGTAKLF